MSSIEQPNQPNGGKKTQNVTSSQREQINFPFENVVFEGGSNKLLVYCGVLRVLEETGTWRQIRRLAGSGTGAVMAALSAIGYDSFQLEEIFQEDLRKASDEGACCVGLTLSSKYGIKSNKRISKWIEARIRDITGDANITFAWVKQRFNRELAIAVTNVQQRCLEFCHPKTTPNLPIREALVMSLASAGVNQPVRNKQMAGEVFIGGGATCSYPLHCFDGWWLSARQEDAFLNRLNNLLEISRTTDNCNRFGKFNQKTFGIIVFDDEAEENISPYLPDCARQGEPSLSTHSLLRGIRIKATKENDLLSAEYHLLTSAARKFIQVIETRDKESSQSLRRDDLDDILDKRVLTDAELRSLFGPNATSETIIRQFHKEKVKFDDFLSFFEDKRRTAHARLTRDKARPIKDVASYFETLNETIESYSRVRFLKRRDVERTVAISTDHVRRSDKSEHLEECDRKFLVQRGMEATQAFLRRSALGGPPTEEGAIGPEDKGCGPELSFHREDLHRFIDDDSSEIIDARDYAEIYDEKEL